MFENTPLEHLSFKALIYKFIVEEGCLFLNKYKRQFVFLVIK